MSKKKSDTAYITPVSFDYAAMEQKLFNQMAEELGKHGIKAQTVDEMLGLKIVQPAKNFGKTLAMEHVIAGIKAQGKDVLVMENKKPKASAYLTPQPVSAAISEEPEQASTDLPAKLFLQAGSIKAEHLAFHDTSVLTGLNASTIATVNPLSKMSDGDLLAELAKRGLVTNVDFDCSNPHSIVTSTVSFKKKPGDVGFMELMKHI